MTNKEYVELIDYIKERSTEFENITVYRVHFTYDPKKDQISKITLKINYTKDGSPMPEVINGKMPKNIVERSENFKGNECTLENIKNWIDDFMKEKGN